MCSIFNTSHIIIEDEFRFQSYLLLLNLLNYTTLLYLLPDIRISIYHSSISHSLRLYCNPTTCPIFFKQVIQILFEFRLDGSDLLLLAVSHLIHIIIKQITLILSRDNLFINHTHNSHFTRKSFLNLGFKFIPFTFT